jgi:hypothetical protein
LENEPRDGAVDERTVEGAAIEVLEEVGDRLRRIGRQQLNVDISHVRFEADGLA